MNKMDDDITHFNDNIVNASISDDITIGSGTTNVSEIIVGSSISNDDNYTIGSGCNYEPEYGKNLFAWGANIGKGLKFGNDCTAIGHRPGRDKIYSDLDYEIKELDLTDKPFTLLFDKVERLMIRDKSGDIVRDLTEENDQLKEEIIRMKNRMQVLEDAVDSLECLIHNFTTTQTI